MMPIARLKYSERMTGKLCRSYAAEVYSALDYDQWGTILDRASITDTEISLLRREINNLLVIRKQADVFYDDMWRSCYSRISLPFCWLMLR